MWAGQTSHKMPNRVHIEHRYQLHKDAALQVSLEVPPPIQSWSHRELLNFFLSFKDFSHKRSHGLPWGPLVGTHSSPTFFFFLPFVFPQQVKNSPCLLFIKKGPADHQFTPQYNHPEWYSSRKAGLGWMWNSVDDWPGWDRQSQRFV